MEEGAPAQIEDHVRICNELISEVGRVVVGQEVMISRLLVGVLAGGHVLLEEQMLHARRPAHARAHFAAALRPHHGQCFQ